MQNIVIILKSNVDILNHFLKNYFASKKHDTVPMNGDRIILEENKNAQLVVVVIGRTWVHMDEVHLEVTLPNHFSTIKEFEKFVTKNFL